MTVAVVPTITVGGQTVAGSLTGDPDLVAVDSLRLTWGRASVLEQPTPATVALTLLDRSPGAVFARRTDLTGQSIVLGWAADDGATGINFRGRITDAAATPRPGAVAGRGFYVAIAASSKEVDLVNYTVPDGHPWPAEDFAGRRNRIAYFLPDGLFAGGITTPTRGDLGMPDPAVPGEDLDTLTAAPVPDPFGLDALGLLRELYASMSPLPMVYDPAADAVTFTGRRRYGYDNSTGMTQSARLVTDPAAGGRYVAAGITGLRAAAGKLAHSGPLAQAIDTRLTRVEVGWTDTDGVGQIAVAGTTDTAAEDLIGRRTLSVSSIHQTSAGAEQLADLYADTVQLEGRQRRLDALGWSSHREPFPDAGHAAVLLAGAESEAALFLRGSWLPQLGHRPLVGILGATVTYAAGRWAVEFTPAPVIVDGLNGWGPLTVAVAAAPAVTLADIDPTVTVGDYGFLDVGAGFTPETAPTYEGNPL